MDTEPNNMIKQNVTMHKFISGKDVKLSSSSKKTCDDDVEYWELLDAFKVMNLVQKEFERVDKAAQSYKTHPHMHNVPYQTAPQGMGDSPRWSHFVHRAYHSKSDQPSYPLLRTSTPTKSYPALQKKSGISVQGSPIQKTYTLVRTDDHSTSSALEVKDLRKVEDCEEFVKDDMDTPSTPCKPPPEDCLRWVQDHLSVQPNISVHRSRLYEEWCLHAKLHRLANCTPSAFGRAIKTAFPDVKSRRLGCRGDSRYYYNGIGVKAASHLHSILLPFHRGNTDSCGHSRTHSIDDDCDYASVTTRGLTEPIDLEAYRKSAETLKLPLLAELNLHQSDLYVAETFLLMYKVHCQRLIDLIFVGLIQQVAVSMATFWSHLPGRLEAALLSSTALQDLVVWCDICFVTALQARLHLEVQEDQEKRRCRVPLGDVKALSESLVTWVWRSMFKFSPAFQQARREVFLTWCTWLKKAVNIYEVACTVNSMLEGSKMLHSLAQMWTKLNIDDICNEVKLPQSVPLSACLARFGCLLSQQVSLSALLKWLKAVLMSAALCEKSKVTGSLKSVEESVMMNWKRITSIISREIVSHACGSLALYQLLVVLLTDYLNNLFLECNLHITEKQCKQQLLKKNEKSEKIQTSTELLVEFLKFSREGETYCFTNSHELEKRVTPSDCDVKN